MLDAKLARLKELIIEKEEIDAEIEHLLGGAVPDKKTTRRCSKCGMSGHRASTCTNPPYDSEQPPQADD